MREHLSLSGYCPR